MNKVIGTEKDYEKFVNTIQELDEEEFPIVLERDDPEEVTITEIKEFINKFKADTGLDMGFHLNTCDDCGRMHMTMVIDVTEDYQYGKLHVLQ